MPSEAGQFTSEDGRLTSCKVKRSDDSDVLMIAVRSLFSQANPGRQFLASPARQESLVLFLDDGPEKKVCLNETGGTLIAILPSGSRWYFTSSAVFCRRLTHSAGVVSESVHSVRAYESTSTTSGEWDGLRRDRRRTQTNVSTASSLFCCRGWRIPVTDCGW